MHARNEQMVKVGLKTPHVLLRDLFICWPICCLETLSSLINLKKHSVSTHQDVVQVCEPQWPENGEDWSDGEGGTDMDSGLQAMAEEDEEINVHNEETFGMGV